MPDRLSWNRKIHSRELSAVGAGRNFQRRAAWSVKSLKYLLARGGSRFAAATLPAASTLSFTLIVTLPSIVLRAF